MIGPRTLARVPGLLPLLLLWPLAFPLIGCGYRVAGRGTAIPADVRTITVTAFRNETTRFKIEQELTKAVVRELLARTRFRVRPEGTQSDAMLTGTVVQFWSAPLLVESAGGRTTAVSVNVRMRVRLTDNRTGRVLYENPDYTFTESYEVSSDVSTYFEEGGAALERLSRTFAASLVSSIMEAF